MTLDRQISARLEKFRQSCLQELRTVKTWQLEDDHKDVEVILVSADSNEIRIHYNPTTCVFFLN